MSEAEILVQTAYAARREGKPDHALQLYREACIASGNDSARRAHCLRHIGDLAMELGHRDDAREALRDAEALYRGAVGDVLALANTVRLSALLDDDKSTWAEARSLYERAGLLMNLDLRAALDECDRHLK